jgi:hypothetical protein
LAAQAEVSSGDERAGDDRLASAAKSHWFLADLNRPITVHRWREL